MLVALTPGMSRAEGAGDLPREGRSLEATDPVYRTGPGPSGATRSRAETTGEDTLGDPDWDFIEPGGLSRSASAPDPVLSNQEIAD